MTNELKLENTVKFMLSDDFRKRGIGEYLQIMIRTKQNREFIRKWKANELTFIPCNTLEQSEMQLKAMELYQYTLKERLKTVLNIDEDEDFETIVLTEYFKSLKGIQGLQ